MNPRIPEPSESTAEQIDLAADRRALTAGIRLLSAGNVVEIPPNGPVLKGRQASPRFFSPDTFVPTLRRSDRILAAGLTVGWLVCVGWFWLWWLEPEHRVNWVGLLVSSTLLCYLTCEPISFMVAVNRLRHVDPRSSIPNLRCAFVVTRAPSEPWEVARTTLSAMLAQEFPHGYDVWLCDEQPTAEVIGWCAGHNVRISTRSGVGAYHRREWPRRTRCKEGNLAYFYDHTGYENYDVVAQLDCDHVPVPGYLAEMVRPFADPAIGYVAAPSVCDANAASSWSARGRVHREAYFHGAVQLGHSSGLAPICVGSHYAVRTKAVRDIGGIGPELLEDFSTSFLLNSAGWQGAFAIAAEAHGNGPLTVSAMLVQEFQWTRSLSTLLYRVVPPHLGRLAWRLRLRFVYSLLFHTALIATIVCGLVLPAIAAVTGVSWVNVSYLGFGLHWWSISIWIVALTMLLRRRGLLRPVRAPILSWENWLYRLTRWPFIAWGVCAAAVALFRPRPITFKVTPKAADGLEPLPPKVIAPYVTISVVLAGAALVGELSTTAAGWVFLCLLGAAVYAVVTFAVCFLHAVEASRSAGVGLARAIAETVRAPLLISALTIPFVTGGIVLYPGYASGVFGW